VWTGASPLHADDDDFDNSIPVNPDRTRRDVLSAIEELTPMLVATPDGRTARGAPRHQRRTCRISVSSTNPRNAGAIAST